VTQATATIHVVDDDESLRTALMRLLRAAGYVVRTYASAGDFLLNKPGNAPGCVILDVRMPGPSGFELQEAIAKLDESLPIIFLSGHGDIPMSVRAIKAGAVDFLTKPVRRETLLQAVRTALAGSAEGCATRELLHSLRSRYESLTPREREVFARVVSGKLNKQIAGELGTCERTVKAHRAHVMEKMQLTSVAELVHAADQLMVGGIPALHR
jgi:FixJ family two-component response regulator